MRLRGSRGFKIMEVSIFHQKLSVLILLTVVHHTYLPSYVTPSVQTYVS